jgi:hypothetical protein
MPTFDMYHYELRMACAAKKPEQVDRVDKLNHRIDVKVCDDRLDDVDRLDQQLDRLDSTWRDGDRLDRLTRLPT